MKKNSMYKNRSLVSVLVVVMILVLTVGCSSGFMKSPEYMDTNSLSSSQATMEMGGGYGELERDMVSPEMAKEDNQMSVDVYDANPATGGGKETLNVAVDDSGEINTGDRKISYTADINVETNEYDKRVMEVEEIIKKYNGIVENSYRSGNLYTTDEEIAEAKKNLSDAGDYSSSYYNYNYRYSNITVKVPVENFELFLADLEKTGNVTYYNKFTNDLTVSYQDIERTKKAYETEYNKYLDLLSKAETLEDTITIESKITDLRLQLDNLETNLKNIDTQVDYSTVTVNYSEVKEYTPQENPNATFVERIVEGLKNTFIKIKTGSVDFAVWFIVNLPILIPVAIITIIVIILIRRSSKKDAKNVKTFFDKSYKPYKPIEEIEEIEESQDKKE